MGSQITLQALAVALASVFMVCLWKALNSFWLWPKKIERSLRRQGLHGNSFQFPYGDFKDSVEAEKESASKAMNLSDDIVPRLLPFIDHSIKKHGKDSFVWVGSAAWINIMKPELIREAFNKIHDFQKPAPNPLVELLGTGLANYEGDRWAKHRRLINPAFHVEKLKNMLPALHLSCSETLATWEKHASDEGLLELDVWPELQTMMRDAISRTAFGSSYEEGKRIFELQKELADLAIQVVQTLYIPGWRFLPTKTNMRMKKLDKEIQETLRTIITKKEKAIASGQAGYNDLLGILLESNSKEIEQHENDRKAGLSMKEVIEECKLFYFAGQETTSSLLVWTLILLSIHQDWQAQARDEVLHILKDGQIPDWESLNHLKIVTMILHEVLRLYPPVVFTARTVERETILGNLTLLPGVTLAIPILSIHHDKELWGEDVNEFKPERFSEGVFKATKGRAVFIPFGWGPRMCIGQNFAMTEAKIAIAMILSRFCFKLSPVYTHALQTVLVVQPQHGAHLIIQKL